MECVYRVLPTVNQYDWGKRREDSLVYRLFKNYFKLKHVRDKNLDQYGTFSELWLGTHPSSPSIVLPSGDRDVTLGSFEGRNDDLGYPNLNVGSTDVIYLSDLLSTIYFRTSGDKTKKLKILLKVLSIQKPLSVQLHPDDDTAQNLFSTKHVGIVDGNAKPEMCIALTKFRAMCGFNDIPEILKLVEKHEEFKKFIGKDLIGDYCYSNPKLFYLELLNKIFFGSNLAELVEKLAKRLRGFRELSISEDFFITLYNYYGRDNCVFFSFILNCLELNPGESLFIPPNTLHSYISGDCIEVMKNSDNVIRCGFTGKFKDIDLCLSLLGEKFVNRRVQDFYVPGTKTSNFILKYEPKDPICNFIVWSLSLDPGKEDTFEASKEPCLCIVLESNPEVTFKITPSVTIGDTLGLNTFILKVDTGDCFLLPPNTSLNACNDHSLRGFKMYISSENSWTYNNSLGNIFRN